MNNDRSMEMFGVADINAWYAVAKSGGISDSSLIQSLASDVQEAIDMNYMTGANTRLNRIKWIADRMTVARRAGSRARAAAIRG
jgi:hypothetical protein